PAPTPRGARPRTSPRRRPPATHAPRGLPGAAPRPVAAHRRSAPKAGASHQRARHLRRAPVRGGAHPAPVSARRRLPAATARPPALDEPGIPHWMFRGRAHGAAAAHHRGVIPEFGSVDRRWWILPLIGFACVLALVSVASMAQ